MSNMYVIPYYPVGSILEFDRAMNMNTIYGGKWELYGVGRMTVGINISDTDFNTSNKTGGSKTHTQTTDEMPSHAHAIGGVNSGVASTPEASSYPVAIAQDLKFNWMVPEKMMTGVGMSQPMSILNPYIVVYRYRKTSD